MTQPIQVPAQMEQSPSGIALFTLAWARESSEQVDPHIAIIDNSDNLRPDWFEYWPIRNYLLNTPVDAETLYGFFSPKFTQKTGLTGADVIRFIQEHPEADVYTFSPQADMGAFFLNTFEQGEAFDRGFRNTCQDLLEHLGFPVDLHSLVMDPRQTVFSNFIVARPAFWQQWLELCEKIFQLSEDTGSPWAERINVPTSYPGNVSRKVFITERMASLLLSSGVWRCAPYSTFSCAWSALPTGKFRDEAVICHALKLAYNETKDETFLAAYAELGSRIFSQSAEASPPRQESTPARTEKSPPEAPAIKSTPAHNVVNTDLMALIPPHARRIVEVGCMQGALAKAYRSINPHAHFVGIDIEPSYAEVASQFCDGAMAADIESLPDDEFHALFPSDCWIFGDCLEHLRDPWRVVRKVRKLIDPDGCMLVCLPNAQHWSVQMRLATGQFHYEDSGLLDRTHLRWFTRTTMLNMFGEAGWKVERGVARHLPTPAPPALLQGISAVAAATGGNVEQAVADAQVFQFLFKLVPA